MARGISQKAQLELYRSCDSKQREIYRKLLRSDLIKNYNYLFCKGLWTIESQANQELVTAISDSEDFQQMFNLNNRLYQAAQAVNRLEKYFKKLTS